MAGIPVADLVSYGPLRHFAMPPEFRELYLRVSGLHPALLRAWRRWPARRRGASRGWALLPTGLLARRTRLGGVGGAFLAAGLLANALVLREPIVTTGVRGLPLLLAVAGLVALVDLRRGDPSARLPLAAALLGFAFAWRTALWTVPVFAYAPLAAVSTLPAVAWLLGVRIPRAAERALRPRGPPRRRPAPPRAAPLPPATRPLLPRTPDGGRRSRGPLAAAGRGGRALLEARGDLSKAGVKDRDLVVLPEAGALGFLLGVRSPLRFEQVLPGHVDARVDRDLAGDLDRARPARVVFVSRPTPEYGPVAFGRDYAVEVAARLARDYDVEARFTAGEMTAVVLRRR